MRIFLAVGVVFLMACGREPMAPHAAHGPCILDAYIRGQLAFRFHYDPCPSDSAIAADHLVREP